MMPTNALGLQKSAALSRVGNGASWFLWIGGMSLINAVIAMTGLRWQFILGLGLTEMIDAIPASTTGHAIALGCDLLIAGTWALFYWQAKQGKRWAFIVGMVLYVLDALLLVFAQEYLAVAFHAYALFRIFPGLQAIGDLRRIEQAERQQAAMAASQIGYAPAPGVWPPPPGSSQPQPGAWPPPADPPKPGVYPPANR